MSPKSGNSNIPSQCKQDAAVLRHPLEAGSQQHWVLPVLLEISPPRPLVCSLLHKSATLAYKWNLGQQKWHGHSSEKAGQTPRWAGMPHFMVSSIQPMLLRWGTRAGDPAVPCAGRQPPTPLVTAEDHCCLTGTSWGRVLCWSWRSFHHCSWSRSGFWFLVGCGILWVRWGSSVRGVSVSRLSFFLPDN